MPYWDIISAWTRQFYSFMFLMWPMNCRDFSREGVRRQRFRADESIQYIITKS